ncbi:hypothetical protein [Caulobacter sp. RHG1]|uniref:hypothetical protein n=1 Tax=Caulobacter sp. (strain RHG1) TaxID=2545762 RepID=UPI001557DB07|nr:hypothetical protein [Caulobacter sp. RHG1]
MIRLIFHKTKAPTREDGFDVDAFIASTSPLTSEDVFRKLAALFHARPEDVIHLGPELCASLFSQYIDARPRAMALMRQHPRLAWLLAFHSNGRIREPALRSVDRAARDGLRVHRH